MAVTYTQAITLDLNCRQIYHCVTAKAGDQDTRFVNITIEADGRPFDVTGLTAKFRCAKPDGTFVLNPAIINDDGTVTVELTDQILAVSGAALADLYLCGENSEIISTASFVMDVAEVPSGENVTSSSEFLELVAVIQKSNTLIGDYTSALEKLEEIWESVKRFPPVVTVTEVAGGHQVTVADQNGTQSFLVADGPQGPVGESGTATDEQVAAWLEAHPEVTTSLQDGEVTPEKTSFIRYDRDSITVMVPDFTNQIPLSTDTDGSIFNTKGWKENTRINSSGVEVDIDGFHITGFIAVAPGDIVRTGPGVIVGTNDNQSLCRYNAAKTFLGRISYNAFAENDFTVSDDGALYAPQSPSVTELAYIRIVGGGIGDDAVVTVNEEITYTAAEGEGVPYHLRLDESISVPLAQKNKGRIDSLEEALEAVATALDTRVAQIPEFVRTEAERVAALAADTGDEKTFRFLAMSDLHYIPGAVNTPAILHLGQAGKIIADTLPLDAAVLLGDVISGASGDSLQTCKNCFARANQLVADAFAGIPNVRLNGNHDCQPYNVDGFLTQAQIYTRVGAWNGGSNGDANYGYRDFGNRKIRVIYLNTCDIYGISIKSNAADFTGNRIGAAQLRWLITVLADTPADWGIIVLGHHPLDWVSNYYIDADGTQWEQNTVNAAAILSGYVQQASGSVWLEGQQIFYDFTAAEPAAVIAYFHGHTHNYVVGHMGDAQILRIAIPNALPGRENEYTDMEGMHEAQSYPKTPETAQDTAFCVVVIDQTGRKIHAFHYGAGYDREISF